jgi:hypothetical protein
LELEAYMGEGDRVRRPLEVTFVDVDDLACVADFSMMATNARAGNINYWAPSLTGGTSYVYLNEGCISIKAREVRVSGQS